MQLKKTALLSDDCEKNGSKVAFIIFFKVRTEAAETSGKHFT